MIDAQSWVVIYPEIILLVMACAITLVDVLLVSGKRVVLTYFLTIATLVVLAMLEAVYAMSFSAHGFGGMLVSDSLGSWLKCFAALAVTCTVVYSCAYAQARQMLLSSELFILSLFSLLGIFMMISGKNFLIIYIGLELLTLSSYVLVALRRENADATEAAMKYFVLGALASGFMLYGLSLLYGATGTLDINEVFHSVLYIQQKNDALVAASGMNLQMVLMFALVFIVAGLAFKLGAVPFHMWMPDVYQGAPTPVTLLVAAAPKLAAFAIMIRLLVEALLPMAMYWQQMMVVLAVASLLVGNLAAIMQTNIKRMLAYSTIAQIGFVLLAFSAGVTQGSLANVPDAYSAAMFYVVTYVLTTLATFGVLLVLSNSGCECDNIADLAGLNSKSPLYAGVMAVALLSLAGIPPLVGFYAKLTVLQALVATGVPFYIGLAVFAVIMSLIAAFYYLRVIKVMYFDKADPSGISLPLQATGEAKVTLSLNGALILVLGIFPAGLMAICANAVWGLLRH